MYSGTFSFVESPATLPATNSPLHPSDVQMPVSPYPHVFPRRDGALPVDFASATLDDVSAAQCVRAPALDSQTTCFGSAAFAVVVDC